MCDPESLSWCVFARPHQDFISKSWNYRRRGEINDLSELLHGIDSESMVEPIRHPCVPMAGTAVFERFHFESKLWESAAKFRSGHLAIVSEEPIREPIFDGVGMWTPPQKQPKPVAKVRRVWDLDHQQPPGAQSQQFAARGRGTDERFHRIHWIPALSKRAVISSAFPIRLSFSREYSVQVSMAVTCKPQLERTNGMTPAPAPRSR